MQTYVAIPKGVHRQQVVPMAQLEPHHLLGRPQVRLPLDHRLHAVVLLVLVLLAGHVLREVGPCLHQLLQEQRVLAHPLYRLQQVTREVHLVTELELLLLEERGAVLGHQGVRIRLVLVVQSVQVELLFLLTKARAIFFVGRGH